MLERPALLLAFGLALGACATTQGMVDIQGKDLDVTQLAGTWSGTFQGQESGRSGTIRFDLVAGYKMAEGKVLMNGPGETAAQPLHVKFVTVAGHRVSGVMAPYADPSCACTVETTFAGEHRKNSIDGTFATKRADGGGAERTGTWSISRQD